MFGRKAFHPVDVVMDSGTPDDALQAFQEADHDVAASELNERRKECLELVKQNIIEAQRRQKEVYDRKYVCPPAFQVGAHVLKKDFTRKRRLGGKLESRWLGPYTVVADLGKGLFQLKKVDDPTQTVSRVHGVHLKPYLTAPQVMHAEPSIGNTFINRVFSS